MSYAVVIPTFNRMKTVSRAIRSALHWRDCGVDLEIIIIDDASTDKTVDSLREEFNASLDAGVMKLICLPANRGVAGAKNAGALVSQREWIIFLDSDDEFVANASESTVKEIETHGDADVIFMRCQDGETSELVGSMRDPGYLDRRAIFRPGLPGEPMVIVKREAFIRFLFPEDLRGCESLAFKRMAFSGCRLWLSDISARIYHQYDTGRLSTGAGFRNRYRFLAIYHFRTLRFCREMGIILTLKSLAKSVYYIAMHYNWEYILKKQYRILPI